MQVIPPGRVAPPPCPATGQSPSVHPSTHPSTRPSVHCPSICPSRLLPLSSLWSRTHILRVLVVSIWSTGSCCQALGHGTTQRTDSFATRVVRGAGDSESLLEGGPSVLASPAGRASLTRAPLSQMDRGVCYLAEKGSRWRWEQSSKACGGGGSWGGGGRRSPGCGCGDTRAGSPLGLGAGGADTLGRPRAPVLSCSPCFPEGSLRKRSSRSRWAPPAFDAQAVRLGRVS